MNPRQACLQCLQRDPPALFEAALWIAAEHDDQLQPAQILSDLHGLLLQVSAGLPALPARELAQPLLRRLAELDYQEDDEGVTRPRHALLHEVLRRRRGQPLSLALIALELARRLDIPLQGVNFPGHFMLRVPGADHLLDPCGGRRLYTRDCRDQLYRQLGRASNSVPSIYKRPTPRPCCDACRATCACCICSKMLRKLRSRMPSACCNSARPTWPIIWLVRTSIGNWIAHRVSAMTLNTPCCSARRKVCVCN